VAGLQDTLAAAAGRLAEGVALGYAYTHPDRWDGHSIGIGQAVSQPRLIVPARSTVRFVGASLRQHQQRTGGGVVLEHFRAGDELDITQEVPGTVFAYQLETLTAQPGLKVHWDAASWEGVQPAPPATRGQDEVYKLLPLPFVYTSLQMLGAVARHNGEPTLLAWPRMYLEDILASQPVVQGRLAAQQTGTLVVGHVAHFAAGRGAGEKVKRIVAVDRLSPAQPAATPKRWLAWLGRTAHQGA
jgi:hypothetical protein